MSPGQDVRVAAHAERSSAASNVAAHSHPGSYRPAVDGLRAVAVAAVIGNHLNPAWWPGGYLGVDVFFVISGFVVSLSLLGRPLERPRGFLLGFYSRRVRRLLPALLTTILGASVLASLVMYPGSLERITSLQTALAALVGSSNNYLLAQNTDYFGISSELNLFLHTWSLGVEEQFYLCFPLIWLVAAGRRRQLVLWIAGCCLASVLLQAWLLRQPQGFNASFYLMPARFWELGVGALLALGLPMFARLHIGRLGRLGDPIALLLSSALIALLTGGSSFSQPLNAALAVWITAALILCLEGRGWVSRAWAQPWLLAVGLRSYGLYLWHWPLIVITRWTVGLSPLSCGFVVISTLVLAAMSYRWIEVPLRSRRWRPRARGEVAVGAAGAGLVAVSLGGLMLPTFSDWLWLGTQRPKGYVPPAAYPHLAYAPEIPGTPLDRLACFQRFSFTERIDLEPVDLQRCHLAPLQPEAGTIFVYGDSYAGHLSPLMARLRQERGIGVEMLIRAQCPFPARSTAASDACARFDQQRRQRVLAAARPGDVLLLASSAREPSGRYSETYLGRLASLTSALRDRGVRVVAQAPLPRFPGSFDPICVYPLQWFQPGRGARCGGVAQRSRAAEWRRVAPLLDQLGALRRDHGLIVWDAFNVLCPPAQMQCSTHREGVRLYRDEGHLSGRGADLLLPSLQSLLFSDQAWPTADPATGAEPASGG